MSGMQKRFAIALLATLLLHGWLGAFVLTRRMPPRPEPPPRTERIDITLVEPPAPKPAEPPPAAPAPPPPAVQPQRRTPLAKAPPLPPTKPMPVVEPPATDRVSESAPSTTEVAPIQPLVTSESPDAPAIDLFAPEALKRSVSGTVGEKPRSPEQDRLWGRLPGEAAGEEAATEEERIAQRVEGATIDATAKARVRAGLVDPAYARLGEAIRDSWDPERALPETSAEMWAQRRAQNAVVGMQLWQEGATRFAATGTPFAEGEVLDESVPSDLRDASNPVTSNDQQRVREAYRQHQRGKFHEGRSAYVLVEREGEKIKVSLIRSSGDMSVDRAAVEDIRRAVGLLAADGSLGPMQRSLWSLRLQIIINPPLPIVGVTFDEVLEPARLELPLGRKLLKRVQLEAVYDDDPRLSPP